MSNTTVDFEEYQKRTNEEIAQLNEQIAELRRALRLPEPKQPTIIDNGPKRDLLAEFIAQNGGDSALIHVGDKRYLLPNGSAAFIDGSFFSVTPPPSSEWENNRARRAYAAAKLERAERDFMQLKAALLSTQGVGGMPMRWTWDEQEYGPQPPETDRYGMPDGDVALKRIKAIVSERRQIVNAIDEEPVALQRRAAEEGVQHNELARIGRDTERRQHLAAINI